MKDGDRVFKAAVWCGKVVVSEATLRKAGKCWWLSSREVAWGFREKVDCGDGYASEEEALLEIGRELLGKARAMERKVSEMMALRADALEMAALAEKEARNG